MLLWLQWDLQWTWPCWIGFQNLDLQGRKADQSILKLIGNWKRKLTLMVICNNCWFLQNNLDIVEYK
ncbi:hypothetical protein L6164_024140 [Bauhinia variegata]|uniref:Uncharacterized protein n=1 Tax=Bauhinia variegata TaxID=167791 RepID=A0ACB9LWV9_BAUVA|nr:hypothetical protein L6164_024140 [Bauhinia variegata]